MQLGLCSLLAAGLISGFATAVAEPFIPEDDTQVLEQLPEQPLDATSRELRGLRGLLTKAPNDVDLATRVSRRYIEESRKRGDPRYLGYAQAALRPWWHELDPPTNVLLLRATIRQSNHEFDSALADLGRLLKTSPGNVQAWVTKATIHQVKGQYDEASQSCAALANLAPTYAVICTAGVGSLNGKAAQGYELLSHALTKIPDSAIEQKVWLETGLAEIATRLDWREKATVHFARALRYESTDPYLKAAYADFLLDEGRPEEVVDLLSEDIRIDGLLLRLALAEQMLGSRNLPETVATLRARFDAARLRGDRIHLREEARFFTLILKEPAEALSLAQANWEIQKEPADARTLLDAALLAKTPKAAQSVLEWIDKYKLEDVALSRIIGHLHQGAL